MEELRTRDWAAMGNGGGSSNWGPGVFGLPKKGMLWELAFAGTHGLGFEICADESALYGVSSSLEVLALKAEDGSYLWRTDLPTKAKIGLSICGDRLYVPPYLLDIRTGEIVADLDWQFREDGLVAYRTPTGFASPVEGPTKGVVQVDQDGGTIFFEIDYERVFLSDCGQRMLVQRGDELAFHHWGDQESKWTMHVPVAQDGGSLIKGIHLHGDDAIMQFNAESLRAFNLETGVVRWQYGPDIILNNATPLDCPSPKFLSTDGTLYQIKTHGDDGYVRATRVTDGGQLWELPVGGLRCPLIAGDLLFGLQHDAPLALDRFTGERVWVAETYFDTGFHAIAAWDNIYFTNSVGGVRCYQWSEPYVSPARPGGAG